MLRLLAFECLGALFYGCAGEGRLAVLGRVNFDPPGLRLNHERQGLTLATEAQGDDSADDEDAQSTSLVTPTLGRAQVYTALRQKTETVVHYKQRAHAASHRTAVNHVPTAEFTNYHHKIPASKLRAALRNRATAAVVTSEAVPVVVFETKRAAALPPPTRSGIMQSLQQRWIWEGVVLFCLVAVVRYFLYSALWKLYTHLTGGTHDARPLVAEATKRPIGELEHGEWAKVVGTAVLVPGSGDASSTLWSPLHKRQCVCCIVTVTCGDTAITSYDSLNFDVVDGDGHAVTVCGMDVEPYHLGNAKIEEFADMKQLPEPHAALLHTSQFSPVAEAAAREGAPPVHFEERAVEVGATVAAVGVAVRLPGTEAMTLQSDTAVNTAQLRREFFEVGSWSGSTARELFEYLFRFRDDKLAYEALVARKHLKADDISWAKDGMPKLKPTGGLDLDKLHSDDGAPEMPEQCQPPKEKLSDEPSQEFRRTLHKTLAPEELQRVASHVLISDDPSLF